MFKVPLSKIRYTEEPENSEAYTQKMNKVYTRYARAYDGFMAVFPLWKKWICSVLPYIEGERVLEVSFGPAYLMSKMPDDIEIHGLDYNDTMVTRAKEKMRKINKKANIIKGNVESLPYPDNYFDTVVNTMAFSGYPNGQKAMSELTRVMKPDGKLLLMDYDFPENRNVFGYLMVKLIETSGDIIRNVAEIIENCGCTYTKKSIGGFGSIFLFIIRKSG
ncbi:MAG: methyltransferase domain-containing protein [Eubacteriales bacterium]